MGHISASVTPRSAIGNYIFHRGSVCVAARWRTSQWDYSCCTLQMTSIAFSLSAASTELGSSRSPIFLRNWQPWWTGSAAALDDTCRAEALAGDCNIGGLRRPRRARCRPRADQGNRRSVDRARRSQGAARLRRPAQSAVLQREGRGVREQARRTVRREAAEEARLHVLPAGDRLRPDDAWRPSLRRHHGLSARRRPGSGHQSLLPHGLCAGRQAGQRPRRRRDAGRRAPEGQAYRHRRRHAAGHEHGGQRPDGERQAISVDDRYAHRTRRRRP